MPQKRKMKPPNPGDVFVPRDLPKIIGGKSTMLLSIFIQYPEELTDNDIKYLKNKKIL